MKSADEKYEHVLKHNTFWFFSPEFVESYETQIVDVLNNLLFNLHEKIKQKGVDKTLFHEVLQKEGGLRAILALNGFSNEQLKRIITLARVVQDGELDKLLNRQTWSRQVKNAGESISEWGTETIERLVIADESFRDGVINLFFEGQSNSLLSRVLPPLDLKKLSIRKLSFEIEPMIDTLVRYKAKGSYSGQSKNNAETAIKQVLEQVGVTFTSGDLSLLVAEANTQKRTMDFIIPNAVNPQIIVESSYLATTSSGQGDKSKTEIAVRNLLKQHYPNAQFIGFVDGIGWYIRKGDLRRMVSAYDDVFTFHEEDIERFRQLVIKVCGL